MQAIGNTYSSNQDNLATNGKVNSRNDKSKASDFTQLLSAINVKNSKKNSFDALHSNLNNQASVALKSNASTKANLKKNNAKSYGNDVVSRNSNLKQTSKNDLNNSYAKNVDKRQEQYVEDEVSSKRDEKVLSDNFKELLGDCSELSLSNGNLDLNASAQEVNDLLNSLNALGGSFTSANDLVATLQNQGLDKADAKNLLASLLGNDAESLDLSKLSQESLDKLSKFIDKLTSQLDSSAFKDLANLDETDSLFDDLVAKAMNLRNELRSKNQANSNGNNSLHEQNLNSYMKDLLADAGVSKVSIEEHNLNKADAALDELTTIEQSLKMNKLVDESKTNLDSKLNNLTENKEQQKDLSLERSIDLLKANAQTTSEYNGASVKVANTIGSVHAAVIESADSLSARLNGNDNNASVQETIDDITSDQNTDSLTDALSKLFLKKLGVRDPKDVQAQAQHDPLTDDAYSNNAYNSKNFKNTLTENEIIGNLKAQRYAATMNTVVNNGVNNTLSQSMNSSIAASAVLGNQKFNNQTTKSYDPNALASDEAKLDSDILNEEEMLKHKRQNLTLEESLNLRNRQMASLNEAMHNSLNNAEHGAENQALFASSNGILGKGLKESNLDSAKLSLSSDLRRNAQAISEKIMEMAARNQKTMNLTLNPKGLGQMRISLDFSNNQDVSKITIKASDDNTKAMLEDGLSDLQESLEQNQILAKTFVESFEDNLSDTLDKKSVA